MGGVNLYRIVGVTAINAGVPTLANDLTPTEAFQIDTKLDDGNPASGVVQADDYTTSLNPGAADVFTTPASPSVTCVSGAGPYSYNTSTTNGKQSTPLCQLLIRPSF